MKQSLIKEKSYAFALQIIGLYKVLVKLTSRGMFYIGLTGLALTIQFLKCLNSAL